VLDSLIGEIPILNLFTGYLANPKYGVTNSSGELIARLTKEPSFFGKKFKLEKLADFKNGDGPQIMLSLMMMLLVERRRG